MWVTVGTRDAEQIQMGMNEANWPQVHTSETNWIQVIPNGSNWFQVIPQEPRWFQVMPSASEWDKWVPSESQASPSEPKWAQVTPIVSKCPSASKPVQMNPGESKCLEDQMATGVSNWGQLDPSWSKSQAPPHGKPPHQWKVALITKVYEFLWPQYISHRVAPSISMWPSPGFSRVVLICCALMLSMVFLVTSSNLAIACKILCHGHGLFHGLEPSISGFVEPGRCKTMFTWPLPLILTPLSVIGCPSCAKGFIVKGALHHFTWSGALKAPLFHLCIIIPKGGQQHLASHQMFAFYSGMVILYLQPIPTYFYFHGVYIYIYIKRDMRITM